MPTELSYPNVSYVYQITDYITVGQAHIKVLFAVFLMQSEVEQIHIAIPPKIIVYLTGSV